MNSQESLKLFEKQLKKARSESRSIIELLADSPLTKESKFFFNQSVRKRKTQDLAMFAKIIAAIKKESKLQQKK